MNLVAPYSPVFLLITIAGTLVTISAPNWMMIWAGLELNLIGVIPLLIIDNSENYTETIMNYFFAQAVGSTLVLLSLGNFSIFLIPALLLNIGAAPIHLWIPPVFNNVSWQSIALLSTWQKIAPLTIFLSIQAEQSYLALGLLGIVWGTAGAINESNLKTFIAYSSVIMIGWLICINTSITLIIGYFIFYSGIILPSTIIFNSQNVKNIGNFAFAPQDNASVLLIFLSLSGIPPLPGFYFNWAILSNIISSSLPLWATFLLIGTGAITYLYLAVALNAIISQTLSFNDNCSSYSTPLLISVCIFTGLIFI